MAIYKFRISFEDYDVTREIDIKSNSTFEDLHNSFHEAVGYKSDVPSSFYVSNDFWHKGDEITIYPSQSRIEKNTSLMSASKLSNFIEDPHQKFYYTSNFERPFDIHVELIRILIDADPKLTYPALVRSQGEAPRQFSIVNPISKSGEAVEAVELVEEDEQEEEEETDEFATHGTQSLGAEDAGNLREKSSSDDSEEEAVTDQEEEEDEFNDFTGEDEEHRTGKEDY